MDRNNIRFLAEKPYRVSWKADGTRYLMLIEDRNKVFFIDRDNCVFQAHGMTFPYRKNPGEHLQDTLCDGVCYVNTIANRFIVVLGLICSCFVGDGAGQVPGQSFPSLFDL